jgi:hypothetical protein
MHMLLIQKKKLWIKFNEIFNLKVQLAFYF